MEIVVNGKKSKVPVNCTVADLLELLELRPTLLAIECNKQIVPKSKYQETQLQDGDVIEIVTFVGGGS